MSKREVKISHTIAKTEDGSVQITFDIPFELIAHAREETLKEYAQSVEVPGFRKGKAPIEEIKKRVPEASVIEHTLGHILPKALGAAITEGKLKLAIYPKFELIRAKEGESWQVRAVSCEIPEVTLGDYKKVISGSGRAKAIWTPAKGSPKEEKGPSKEEKEQEIIKVLLETVKVTIPKILIEEEVNARLSSLLERIEKLGLNLEGYLGSLGKTAEGLRTEYENQARGSITLDLILTAIAREQKIEVKEAEIDAAVKAASGDPKIAEKLNTPEQRRVIAGVLARRAALDSLTALL